MPLKILRKLYPLCEDAGYKLTASLSWDGEGWVIAELEKGDTSRRHYGLAADLGSTTVVMWLIDCTTGECIREVSCYNRQIRFGTDILSRIFYCKDAPDKLEEIRQETIASLKECMKELEQSSGVQNAGLHIHGDCRKYNYGSFSAGHGSVLCILHTSCLAG